jgi:serralysin
MPTQSDIIGALVYGNVRWSTPPITFSIPVTGSVWPGYVYKAPVDLSTIGLNDQPYLGSEPYAPQYQVLNSGQADAFRAAIQAWANLIAVPIVETNDLTNPGEIRVAFTEVGNYGAYTNLPPATGSSATPSAGDIWVSNTLENTTLTVGWDLQDGQSPSPTLLHEIGHALGLKHPFDPPNTLASTYLNTLYTVMSYNYAGVYPGSAPLPVETLTFAAGTYKGAPQLQTMGSRIAINQPMVFDILAIQSIYGANPNYHSGDDVYKFDAKTPFITAIYDAGGDDTIDTSATTRSSYIDLTPGAYSSIGIYTRAEQEAYWDSQLPAFAADIKAQFDNDVSFGILYTFQNNLGIAYSTTIENAIGGAGNDTIIGNAADNKLTGGPGNDVIDGAGGTNTACYSGPSTPYTWTLNPDGSWTVKDLRAGSPDGTDQLTHIQELQFTDRTVVIDPGLPSAVATALTSILRMPDTDPSVVGAALAMAGQINAGTLSAAAAEAQIVTMAASTSSVATVSYQFFTGSAPSAAGMDYLVSPTGSNVNNLNSAYYQSFATENRYINFAVNLGKLGAGAQAFQTAYGALDLAGALSKAYTTIFGTAPSADKVSHLLNDLVPNGLGGTYARANYFAIYGGDGPNGIGTKAAMVGWLMAEAVISDLGTYAKSNDAFLTDVATHNAAFGVDVIGHYAQPGFAYTGG